MARSLKKLTVSNSPMAPLPCRSPAQIVTSTSKSLAYLLVKPTAEDLFGPEGTPRVVVVGAGFGGIAAGVKMKAAGIHSFTIYELSLGIGGTWWDNTYPGAEVDVGSHLYSYSFKPHDWARTHAKQAELQ